MKVRMGFVSNSSSSSFVICKVLMTEEQIRQFSEMVDKFDEEDEEFIKEFMGDEYDGEPCDLEFGFDEYTNYFTGHGDSYYTGPLSEFLLKIGITDNKLYEFGDR
jgi:hypothetical protein